MKIYFKEKHKLYYDIIVGKLPIIRPSALEHCVPNNGGTLLTQARTHTYTFAPTMSHTIEILFT